jgi:hypothetical protein
MITKKQINEYVKQKLATDSKWQMHALVKIYDNQTSDEQINEHTSHCNKVGFSGVHGTIMTSIAKQYINNNWISSKQQALVSKIIPHYWKQIIPLIQYKKLLACMHKDGVLDKKTYMMELL